MSQEALFAQVRARTGRLRHPVFSVYNNSMDVVSSALKHGVAPEDSLHAAHEFIVAYSLGDDPRRELRLGLTRTLAC